MHMGTHVSTCMARRPSKNLTLAEDVHDVLDAKGNASRYVERLIREDNDLDEPERVE